MQSNKSLAFARLLHFKYAHQRLLPKVNRVQRTVPVPTMQALLPANCSICRGSSSLGVRKKRKNTNKVRAYLFVLRSTQNKWVLTHLVRCTDTACLFVCYVRCARFLQMLCACSSLCLRSAETCSSAIVTEGQSRATDGARPNNASIVACKLFDLQGEFKFGVRKKRKNTNKVRAYLFVVRSTQNKWVLTHLVRCTDTACLFVCYVRCARFLQMLCACSSLCLRSTETCSEQSERNSGTGEYYSPK